MNRIKLMIARRKFNRMPPIQGRRLWIKMSIAAVAAVVIPKARPLAAQSKKAIDLRNYRLVFEDNFRDLNISASGPGTRWISHTPWNGDFSDATFVDPQPDFPFTSGPKGLRIEARKDGNGKWQSGLLASADAKGGGFAQQYGYFEMRARLPSGPGVWPAFWLDSMPSADSNDASIEIDVLEHYGKFPNYYNSTVIVWEKDRSKSRAEHSQIKVPWGTLSEAFHTYGVSVHPEWIVMYFDRIEIWRTPTPPEHQHKLMLLLDLAIGGGWPTTDTPSPSFMEVDYVRAYQI